MFAMPPSMEVNTPNSSGAHDFWEGLLVAEIDGRASDDECEKDEELLHVDKQ